MNTARGDPETQPLPIATTHRHRWLWPLIAGLATLLIMVPLAVLLTGSGDDGAQPPPAGAGPGPSAPATATPTTGPTGATAPATAPGPAADGRLTLADLRDATLTIPAWPADAVVPGGPSGRVTFSGGHTAIGPGLITVYLSDPPAHGDIDRDGDPEAAVVVYAMSGESRSAQVLALDRRGDRIVTLGRVVATTGGIALIRGGSLAVTASGIVRVEVGDHFYCCDEDRTITQWQRRGYRWSGGRFIQVTGRSAFPRNPRITDLAVTGELGFGAPNGGVRHGTLWVTVALRARTVPAHLTLTVRVPGYLTPDGEGWSGATVTPIGEGLREYRLDDVPAPAAGDSRIIRLDLTRPADANDQPVGVVVGAHTAQHAGFADTRPADNAVTVTPRLLD